MKRKEGKQTLQVELKFKFSVQHFVYLEYEFGKAVFYGRYLIASLQFTRLLTLLHYYCWLPFTESYEQSYGTVLRGNMVSTYCGQIY
jgi:hypothetical protein